jgi:hypothetical protein
LLSPLLSEGRGPIFAADFRLFCSYYSKPGAILQRLRKMEKSSPSSAAELFKMMMEKYRK